MYNANSDPAITGCVFTGNRAWNGGGMFNEQSDPVLTNCVFSANDGFFGSGGGVFSAEGSPTLTNCGLWGNRDQQGRVESAQVHGDASVSFSCIEGLDSFTGHGNIGYC